MLARDFCYWLQGFVELAQPEIFTNKQLELVESHLKMVAVADKQRSQASDFCLWLQGALSWRTNNAPLPRANAIALMKKLSDVFIHEIDLSFASEHQDELLVILDTPTSKERGIL